MKYRKCIVKIDLLDLQNYLMVLGELSLVIYGWLFQKHISILLAFRATSKTDHKISDKLICIHSTSH